MHGPKYKYQFNPDETLTLKPTNGTKLKAMLPGLIVAAVLGSVGYIFGKVADAQMDVELAKLDFEEDPHN